MSAWCCKAKVSTVVAHCFDCHNTLCSNCLMAHRYMHRFQSHRVLITREPSRRADESREPTSSRDEQNQPTAKHDFVVCERHASEAPTYFCRSCDVRVCGKCHFLDHPKPMHQLEPIREASSRQAEIMPYPMQDGRERSGEVEPSRRPPIARSKDLDRTERGHALPTSGIEPTRPTSPFDLSHLSECFSSTNSIGPFPANLECVGPYETQSIGSGDFRNSISNIGVPEGASALPLQAAPAESASTFVDASGACPIPLEPETKRLQMIYDSKFGTFGVLEAQFTEPSGVAVNGQNDILVADTNNHRIQIFDREGNFKFQFGECGRRAGQLLFPNRVAVVRRSGDIIVTERTPSHQIQIYNQYGQFLRKFGAPVLEHPRGLAVDLMGRVVVVESKVMRVVIFDPSGNLLQRFSCAEHLKFPNGVAVNDREEIFISDNRAHCVSVLNYAGVFLRQIGGEGLTNYPIGVCINQAGEVVVADNHKHFNLTVFTQDGRLINAFVSKSKHPECFDFSLLDDGSAVLACKDCRLYIYRHVQLISSPLAAPSSVTSSTPAFSFQS